MAAYLLELENGKKIWVPPFGKPYWLLEDGKTGQTLSAEERELFVHKKMNVKTAKSIKRSIGE